VDIEPGLTAAEIEEVEHRYGFEFASDHRAFLAEGLPTWSVGDDDPNRASWGWPNWREDSETLRRQIDHPVAQVVRAISEGHWPSGWRRRPADDEQAMAAAQKRLADVPRMIPVYAHRYLPAGRDTSGNPVLSIHTLHDTIVYGLDLADYIDREFRTPDLSVPFWGLHVTT
jgi:hypothetical protein